MQLQRNLDAYAKANGLKTSKCADRVCTPNWGFEITIGKHAGEKLTSYAQCWDMFCECLKGTDALKGIN